MKIQQALLFGILLVQIAYAAGGLEWDYKLHGSDWPAMDESAGFTCGGTNQSPINLKRSGGYPELSSSWDKFNAVYYNLFAGSGNNKKLTVHWNGHTSQVNMANDKNFNNVQDLQNQMFRSNNGKETFGTDNRFKAAQFHFHHGSEHTIDGNRMGLEMHAVHLPENATEAGGFFGGVVAVLFDTEKYDMKVQDWEVVIIDNFFDSLKWDVVTNHTDVPAIPWGELMSLLDYDNRWTYKGSLTTPVCTIGAYWNVMQKILPIKQKHIDQFVSQMGMTTAYDLASLGNYREIQATTPAHNVTVITNRMGSAVVLVVIIILLAIAFLLALVMLCKYYREVSKNEGRGGIVPLTDQTSMEMTEKDKTKQGE